MGALNDVIPAISDAVAEAVRADKDVREYVLIRTCNRLEAYIATDDNVRVKAMLDRTVRKNVEFGDRQFWYILEDKACIKHLFTVICGIDSLIVGEDQIQHQIKESFEQARKEGHVKKKLYALFCKALVVGKRVRTETDLNKGAVSVGYAAIELAENHIGSLENRSIAILGAGDMAGVIAKNLAGKNPKTVIVSNRTFERAQELAKELKGTAVGLDRLGDILRDSDLILVATSAKHDVIKKADVEYAMQQRDGRPLLIIDVSVPTNVSKDVTEIEGVSLSTMESLDSIAAANVAKRKDEISRAESIIRQEMEDIDREEKQEAADRAIRDLSLMFETVRKREADVAKGMLSSEDSAVIDDMSRALINKIFSEVIKNLRKAALEEDDLTIEAASKLFGLDSKEDE
ncbi:glutamyl-tRNA reductase [Thermoplasmatales archaeon BRNA1]|nr:glutamyl-tRNA reductase [Thermoplasmatales archaeon BRNA1]